jgi:hypothetical protein
MRSRWFSAVLAVGAAALLLALLISFSDASSSGNSGTLITYRQEGGIGGPRPSLVVSADRRAKVTLGSCGTRFTLRRGAWRELRAAIKGTDIHGIAGNYPPPPGSADMITYVIRTPGGTVRIAPNPEPRNEEVMGELGPLLKVLDATVAVGQRHMPASCRSVR